MGNKVLIRADAHNAAHGRNIRRFEETFAAFDWTYNVAEKHGCKWVLDAGDVFHDRSHLGLLEHYEVYRRVEKAKNEQGIQTLTVLGNHDMYYKLRSDVVSIVSLDQFGRIVCDAGTVEIMGVPIDVLPYSEHPAEIFKKAWPKNKPNGEILLFHGAFDGAIVNSHHGIIRGKTEDTSLVEQAEEEISDSLSTQLVTNWKLVIGGHYHFPQTVYSDKDCKVMYVGSPISHGFGESNERKRVIILDLETLEMEEVWNDFSPKHIIHDLENDPTPDPALFKNCRVRLDLGPIGLTQGVKDLRQEMLNAGAISVVPSSGRKVSIDKSMHLTKITDTKSLATDTRRMVRVYTKMQSPDHLDSAKLIEIGDKITANASNPAKSD